MLTFKRKIRTSDANMKSKYGERNERRTKIDGLRYSDTASGGFDVDRIQE